MAVRTAMAYLIAELRRKVYDLGPSELIANQHPPGDTVRIQETFRTLASVAKTPATASIKIWDAGETIRVTSGHAITTGVTGVCKYDYKIATDAVQGTWRSRMVGIVSGITTAIVREFTVVGKPRIWSDQELQDILDLYSVFIGEPRELMRRNANFTRFFSEYDHLEWATLYDSNLSTATSYTPATSNLIKGEFTFTTTLEPTELYLEGMSYDIWSAAAECLEELAADPSRAYQWSHGGISQTSVNPLSLAQEYRRRGASPQSVHLNKVY